MIGNIGVTFRLLTLRRSISVGILEVIMIEFFILGPISIISTSVVIVTFVSLLGLIESLTVVALVFGNIAD